MARRQSSTGDPEMKMVSVAVLPPRLPSGMAPPTGIGAAEAFSWDEAVNWQHNDPVNTSSGPEKKSFRQKLGLSTARDRKNPDTPPFIMRQIPYDTWRKHYAKDADGNYRGTHAPAEDCLLKPEDVAKWRLGEAQTKADQWTRGSEALPVYAEVRDSASVPAYEQDTPATHPDQMPVIQEPEHEAPRKTIADGKTAAEIIKEAQEKHDNPKADKKKSFRQMMKSGMEMAMMGN